MNESRAHSKHKDLVETLVNALAFSKCFSDIRADLPGYDQPERISLEKRGIGFKPDVTAVSTQLNIFEIETSTSLNDSKTDEKWRILAAYLLQKSGKFWAVVPSPLRQMGIEKMRALNIAGGVLEF